MTKEMFEHILQKDEKIVWAEGVNKKSYIIKGLIYGVCVSIGIALFLSAFVLGPTAAVMSYEESSQILSLFFTGAGIIFSIGLLITIINNVLNANNTFFAITNKRIIKRSGTFNTRFIHYSLKNVGNVEVIGSIFDSKGADGSAKLIISTKDFHTNTDGNGTPKYLIINSLNKAYKAYNILSEKTEGNNEVFRVKTEK